ncbi:MAG TPA: hypothetical protein ENL15_02795 [Firmicutes bacterium]|nr:hypothetical protein [Bacillota bacterium]
MNEKKLNIQAVIIIGFIIIAVIVNFIAKDRFLTAPGIDTLAFNGDKLYILEGDTIEAYTLNGEKAMGFQFRSKPDAFFFLNGNPVTYRRENGRFTLYDPWFNPLKSFSAGRYTTVTAIGEKIYGVSSKEKVIEILDSGGTLLETKKTDINPYTLFQWKGEIYYTEKGRNVIRKLYGSGEKTFDRIPENGTIIRGVDNGGILHFLYADKSFFSACYYVYDQEEEVLLTAQSKYYIPASLAAYNGYFFVGDNAKGVIDVFAPDHKYICRFGNEAFKTAHERQFNYKKKYLYLGIIMNFVIIALFLWALVVFFIHRKSKRGAGHADTEGWSKTGPA